jgi:hypothetical protein
VIEVEPLICPSEGNRVLEPSIWGGRAGGRHQYLTVVELLLPLTFLRSMFAEGDVDFSIDARERSASSPPPAVEVVKILQVLLAVGEVAEVGRVGRSPRSA